MLNFVPLLWKHLSIERCDENITISPLPGTKIVFLVNRQLEGTPREGIKGDFTRNQALLNYMDSNTSDLCL